MTSSTSTSARLTAATGEAGVPAIDVQTLTKSYKGGVKALEDLSFTVPAGTIYGLLGPNGAGKSTTVKILTTLLQPDSGRAAVAGFDVLRQPNQVRRAIGCVNQKSGVDIDATARENLILQGRIYGLRAAAARRRSDQLIEMFDLGEAANRLAKTLSGGMQRKLDIALGLVHEPDVLFMDEPTTGLDPEARTDLWREISSLATTGNHTILLTTHYLDEADRLAQRLVIIDKGKAVAEGTPAELKAQLKGDSVHIVLDGDYLVETVRTALVRVAGVRDVTLSGASLNARADNGATALPAMLAALERAGITARATTIAQPSLDDVYLKYAGRAYHEADQGSKS